MSIVRIPYPSPLPTLQQDYVEQNDLIETGFLRVNDPHRYAGGNVLKGSIFQVGGTVYLTTADTAIAGAQSEYVKLVPLPDGSELDPEYVANLGGVSWNDVYNGYYDGGGNLYVFNEQKLVRKGDMAIALTHYTDTTVPAIAVECSAEINGGLYTNFSEIAIGGATANDNWYDILLTPSGSTFTASFIARETGVWSDSKQGLYDGNNRVVACVYRDGSGNFINKNVLDVINRTIEIKIEIGDWNMDGGAGTIDVGHGLTTQDHIKSISAIIRKDVNGASWRVELAGNNAGHLFAYDLFIRLYRTVGPAGIFDNPNYDSTSYNRGWITVGYEV